MHWPGNRLAWGWWCGLTAAYDLAHTTLRLQSVPLCQTHKLFFGILDRLPTFSHLSSVSFPGSRLFLLFPPPISLIIIPSISFSISLTLSFSHGHSSCYRCVHVATCRVFHCCRLLTNKNPKQVKAGGCWTEGRMNEFLLEGRDSAHKAFAAQDRKGKSIPIKSINSLLSGNNKDFY